MRHTKILATLGPATEEKSEIRALVQAGMDIVRLNFSHGTYDQFKKIVKNIREVEKESGKTIAILQDLQGPKIRLGELPKEGILVKRGEVVTFLTTRSEAKRSLLMSPPKSPTIPLPYPILPQVLKKGHSLLIEDGLIRTKILSIKGHEIRARVLVGGLLKSKKGVNIPDSRLPSSEALTEKDKNDLAFAVKVLGVDAIAVSFVETAKDLERVRKEAARYTQRRVFLIAKVERPKALINLKEIINESDAIMVARGDLGIEIPAEQVPIEQKRIIALCRRTGKPVIIATQILQSMENNPLATRAEISDAANAIFEHADAFMLSNETAVGKYPIRAVQTLAKVAARAEEAIFKNQELFPIPASTNPDLIEDETLALNACMVADQVDAEAIVVLTRKGYTAAAIAKHRPKNRILVVTDSIYTARRLHFFWGIHDVLLHKGPLRSEESLAALRKSKMLSPGSSIVLVKLSDAKRSLVMMTV